MFLRSPGCVAHERGGEPAYTELSFHSEVGFEDNSSGLLRAAITFVSEQTAQIVIPVTKFRDEGHLPYRNLERRCPWKVTAVSVFQVC